MNTQIVYFLLFIPNIKPMSVKWVRGRTRIRRFPRSASTTFTKQSLVYWASGVVIPADATSGDHIGICVEDVTSSDSDFATANVQIAVEVPADKQCVFEADVTGTLVTTSVGVAYDLSTALVVDQGNTSKLVVTCVGFITSTKGLFVLNATYDTHFVVTS